MLRLIDKWERVSPSTREQLQQMVSDQRLINKFTATISIEQSGLPAGKTRQLGIWHAGLMRFTDGRFDQALESEEGVESQLDAVRAAIKKHKASLERLENNDFSLKLDLDTAWLESTGREGCPNFSTFIASFGDALQPEHKAIVQSHFDQCVECADQYDAEPSLAGYFPPYEIKP